MKVIEKGKAIMLRKKGVSMNEIAQKLGVAKGSVSYWVRDVELTKSQKDRLNKNGHSIEAIEKRRIARIQGTRVKRQKIMAIAADEVIHFKKDPLWCAGVALYWGEGGKTQQTVRISNSDPDVLKVMMLFFNKYSGIPSSTYHAHIHTYPGNNVSQLLAYWSKVIGVPQERFYRTYVKQSSASKHKRKTLPYGTLQIYIHSTEFFFRMMGWLEGYKNQLLR